MSFEDLHRPLHRAGFRGAVRIIIILCTIVLVLQQFFPGPMAALFALTPKRVWHDHWWWQTATYLFLHGGIFHWLFNMFILWMFGRELEIRWGTPYFLWYFFLTGIGAAVTILLLSRPWVDTNVAMIPTMGASG